MLGFHFCLLDLVWDAKWFLAKLYPLQYYSAFHPIFKGSSCSCPKAISSTCQAKLLLWYSSKKLWLFIGFLVLQLQSLWWLLQKQLLFGDSFFFRWACQLISTNRVLKIFAYMYHFLLLSLQDLNSAHQSYARLHSGFFGIPHMISVVKLLGSRSLPWLIRALLDHISNKVCMHYWLKLFLCYSN